MTVYFKYFNEIEIVLLYSRANKIDNEKKNTPLFNLFFCITN